MNYKSFKEEHFENMRKLMESGDTFNLAANRIIIQDEDSKFISRKYYYMKPSYPDFNEYNHKLGILQMSISYTVISLYAIENYYKIMDSWYSYYNDDLIVELFSYELNTYELQFLSLFSNISDWNEFKEDLLRVKNAFKNDMYIDIYDDTYKEDMEAEFIIIVMHLLYVRIHSYKFCFHIFFI